MARKPQSSAKPGKPTSKVEPRSKSNSTPGLYTLEAFLISGPIADKFIKQNPIISRTIQIRGDQNLEDLHLALFGAFDRFDQHMYEFQFGKHPMDPKGPRYVSPQDFEMGSDDDRRPPGRADQATLDSLGLSTGRSFGYWFDFGDDWWHQIDVIAIDDVVPAGEYPRVTNRVGASPPQYK